MAIVDVVTYNGEKELFDLRYNILKDYVDEFIVVEFGKTFSGKDKPAFFSPLTEKYPKVRYWFNKESDYIKYKELAENSPNTQGAEHWKTEFMQKESIKDCLTHLKNEDIVFIGDCDEIWEPNVLKFKVALMKLKLKVYTYYLNNRSDEQFWGTVVAEYIDIKDSCLNHMRINASKSTYFAGWHFTSMANSLAQKLKDSYTKEDYASDIVMQNLEENITNNRDFLGRNFTYTVNESEWPQYLKDNRDKYKHLLK